MIWTTTPQQLELPIGSYAARPYAIANLPANLQGALWMLLAAGFYAVVLVLVKAVGERLHPAQILLFRSLVMVACVLPAIALDFPASVKTTRSKLHAARIASSFLNMLLWFIAIVHLPLADATTLSFSKGFFATLLAALILGEAIGARRMSAIVLGFTGIVIALNPGSNGSINVFGVLVIVAAMSEGLSDILVRRLSRTDSAVTIMTYQAVGLGVLVLPAALWFWKMPDDVELILLTGVGVFSALAQYCNTLAFRSGDVPVVATLDYARLLYVVVFTLLLFQQWPEPRLLFGATIIVCAGVYAIRVRDESTAKLGCQVKRFKQFWALR